MSSIRTFATVLCLLLVAAGLGGCVVVTTAPDYPVIEDVYAACDDLGWWDLWAQVSHPQGPEAVTSVWVEVSYVFYDSYDNREYDFLGAIDLEPVDSTLDEWGVFLAPEDPLLDCDYPAEYGFLFVAQDLETDQSSAEIIN